jgi:hypothetical protein
LQTRCDPRARHEPNRDYFVEVVAGVVAVLAGAVAAGDEVEVVFGAL